MNLDGFAKDVFTRLSELRESEEEREVKDIKRGVLQERIDRIDKLNNIRKQYLSDYYIVVYGRQCCRGDFQERTFYQALRSTRSGCIFEVQFFSQL